MTAKSGRVEGGVIGEVEMRVTVEGEGEPTRRRPSSPRGGASNPHKPQVPSPQIGSLMD